jgi:membrane-bound lytic murein transglycosylase D
VHDDRYLNVVYEIVNLPGGITPSYTPMQQDLIRERRGYWQYRLQELGRKVARGLSLDPDDQALIQYIATNSGSTSAVYGAGERVRIQRGQRERFKRGLEISGRYDAVFRDIFRQAGLPEDLAYLPHVESSFQANAHSSAGAVGIWQFTRSAARVFMNVDGAVDERLNPVASARGAARYLRYAYDRLGSWPLALTAYNHGIAGMQRARDAFGTDFMRIVYYYNSPQFGFASRNFYAEFLAARDVARQPERFFPEGVRYERPLNRYGGFLGQNMPVKAWTGGG